MPPPEMPAPTEEELEGVRGLARLMTAMTFGIPIPIRSDAVTFCVQYVSTIHLTGHFVVH